MSKKAKVLISALVVVLLSVGIAVPVMAQEEPTPLPEVSTEIFAATANTTGLLARVADKLGITQEELVNAFKQARQEMRDEAFFRALDEAVEKGLIDEGEAEEIKKWWAERPEVLSSGLFQRAFGVPSLGGRHRITARNRVLGEGCLPQKLNNRIMNRWEGAPQTLRARISPAIRNRQMISVPRRWHQPVSPELTD